MSNTYDIGDLVRVSVTFTDADDAPADPTAVTFQFTDPSDETTTYTYGVDDELVKDDTGDYHVDVSLAEAGRYYYRWAGTGTVKAAEEDWFGVRESRF